MTEATLPPDPVSALSHAAGVLREIANHVDISNLGRYKWTAMKAADRAETVLAAIEAAATPVKARRCKPKTSHRNAAPEQTTSAAALATSRTGPGAPAAR